MSKLILRLTVVIDEDSKSFKELPDKFITNTPVSISKILRGRKFIMSQIDNHPEFYKNEDGSVLGLRDLETQIKMHEVITYKKKKC